LIILGDGSVVFDSDFQARKNSRSRTIQAQGTVFFFLFFFFEFLSLIFLLLSFLSFFDLLLCIVCSTTQSYVSKFFTFDGFQSISVKVDDGLPLRKVALTCVETVLDMLPEYVQAETFIPRLVILLSDKVSKWKL
jgi:hypothetical protein